jgi:hypothetical protein
VNDDDGGRVLTPDVNRGGRDQIRLAGEKGGPTRMEKGSHQGKARCQLQSGFCLVLCQLMTQSQLEVLALAGNRGPAKMGNFGPAEHGIL